jgi:hypothetical protein
MYHPIFYNLWGGSYVFRESVVLYALCKTSFSTGKGGKSHSSFTSFSCNWRVLVDCLVDFDSEDKDMEMC